MSDKKTTWDDIPSVGELSVDWSYEAENPLGKRERIRIGLKDLKRVLGVKNVPVRVVSETIDEKAVFVDFDQGGAAVLLKNKLEMKEIVKIGFMLGEEKIVSLAVVKNVNEEGGNYRTGLQFKNLKPESVTTINAIATSKNY